MFGARSGALATWLAANVGVLLPMALAMIFGMCLTVFIGKAGDNASVRILAAAIGPAAGAFLGLWGALASMREGRRLARLTRTRALVADLKLIISELDWLRRWSNGHRPRHAVGDDKILALQVTINGFPNPAELLESDADIEPTSTLRLILARMAVDAKDIAAGPAAARPEQIQATYLSRRYARYRIHLEKIRVHFSKALAS